MPPLRHSLAALLAGGLLCVGPPPAADELPPPVQRVLDGHGLDAGDLSIHVHELGSGREVLAHHADTPRNPASVLKLLTTFAALDVLGPAHTWRTEVYLDGRLEDGVLAGNLVLRGGGDPYLVQERFWLLLRELRRRGLQRIEGDLVIDSGYFRPAPEDRSAFDNQPLRAYNVTPHALLVNFNVVRFWFEPVAAGVLVEMEPPLANLRMDSRRRGAAAAISGASRCGPAGPSRRSRSPASSPPPAAAIRWRAACWVTRISCSACSPRCGGRWAGSSTAPWLWTTRRQTPSASSPWTRCRWAK